MWRNYVRHKILFYYAPGDPKIPLQSENPNEYLSLALYLTFPVVKSPSIAVFNGALTKCLRPLGTSVLSKGGSGDVLTGLIGSLLAQGYTPVNAAINGSLAHTIAASNYKGNNYSLSPEELISQIKKL